MDVQAEQLSTHVLPIRQDPDHEAILTSSARHLVVTAPPGTGKTFLSIRIAGRLARELNPGARILVLTFSNQARSQLEVEAARHLIPAIRARVEVTNYHRFFLQGVAAYARALGLPMELDIGSRQRRQRALEMIDRKAVRQLARADGLIESLAEHGIAQFRDHRTPEENVLVRLLAMVESEQRAGRLVFDDLGALFWQLLDRFPAVEQAYCSRYPIVIADEHQDASALQDAIVRRLGRQRLVIFADPMQLIHGFRGANHERLDRHLAECAEQRSLRTPHRWHGAPDIAEWLLAMRSRLEGRATSIVPPSTLLIKPSPANRGFNGMKPVIKYAVSNAFGHGARTVAVLARTNVTVAELRTYLCQQGQFPRQIGTEDFEDARIDIEQLPLLTDANSIAHHAVTRLQALLPTVSSSVWKQVTDRISAAGIRLGRAGREATLILRALEPIYQQGPGCYFQCVCAAVLTCAEAGHHVPRSSMVRVLRSTTQALGESPRVEAAVRRYAANVVAASTAAPRIERGLLVMTAHQAKGKEFDAVIIPDLSERYWPDDGETRRLFYVALTRATESWTIVHPDERASQLVELLK